MNEKKRTQIEEYKRSQYIDDRELFTFTTIKKCHVGVWGMVFMSIKGDSIYVFGADFRGTIGKLLFTIPIKDMEDIKIPHRISFSGFRFKYNGVNCVFDGGLYKNSPICNAILEIKEGNR